ncbi:MAG: toxic anion resistance protein [Gammaproteobacteria bacterium]
MSTTTDAPVTTDVVATGLSTGKEIVPGVGQDLIPYEEAQADERTKIESLINEIDMHDSNSIIFFGSKAQQEITTISDNMLEGVRNKDTGAAGAALNDMVATLRGFDVDGLDPNYHPGFFARLFGKAKPIVEFLQRYEGVSKQIDTVTDKLEGHKTNLLTDIAKLDRLYSANLDYFHTLEYYIAAGDEKFRVLDAEAIPALDKKAKASNKVIKAQELRDLRTARDDLERRVHDLRLTRQVAMQSLPSIRLVQENDKGLVTKIQSTLTNTVPLWRQQLAQAVTIYRSGQAAETVKSATDLTNELLEANAENLKTANAEVRKQIERGVFDIETVKKANDTLIETIEESLRIAEEGKRARTEAVAQLEAAESDLKASLQAAKAKAAAPTES